MPVKTSIKKALGDVFEQAVKPTAKDAANQINPMGSELVKMLYWSDAAPPQNSHEINKKGEFHKSNDSKALEEARKKHASILGDNSRPQESQTPLVNPSVQTPEQLNRKMVIEHHKEAEELGVKRGDEEAQKEKQKEKQEEEEKLAKAKAEKEALENPIEAPAGRQTGVSFGRRKPKSKMTKPPVSTETRGSNNRE